MIQITKIARWFLSVLLLLQWGCAKEESPPVEPDPVLPSAIATESARLAIGSNATCTFRFEVTPADASLVTNLSSADCNIALHVGDNRESPEHYTLQKVTRVIENGIAKPGQYLAQLRDRGTSKEYKEKFRVGVRLKSDGDQWLYSDPVTIERDDMPLVEVPTGLPVLHIQTDENRPIVSKEVYLSAQMKIVGNEAFPDFEKSPITIRGRGNSTWTYPKKPYAVKLNKKSEVMGMPAHKSWVLLANWMDRTLLRNRVSFYIAEQTGLAWTPRSRFVEVVINGKHVGNYLLCEQIKVDANRVNVTSLKSSHTDEATISGGYLLELDTYFDEVNKFRTDLLKLPVMLKDPDEETLNTPQFNYIRNYFNRAEQLIFSEEADLRQQSAEYIDFDSFIDWWFVHELAGNEEPKHPKSSYMHKERNGKLCAGPVWDFDWETFLHEPKFLVKNHIWYSGLFRNPAFVTRVKERWTMLKPRFVGVSDFIVREREAIRQSWALNATMWPLNPGVNQDEALDFDAAAARLQKKYEAKLKWLDAAIEAL
ncbi:MAG: CotH kinase family protein [Bacteroidales bacterium]